MATMGLSNFGYSLREAGSHFRRNWSTALGAIVTIFLSLFIIGLFILGLCSYREHGRKCREPRYYPGISF